jgi:hypothetical protein
MGNRSVLPRVVGRAGTHARRDDGTGPGGVGQERPARPTVLSELETKITARPIPSSSLFDDRTSENRFN